MNETIINNWNNTVGPTDRVFVLGDVVINRKYLPMLSRLMGKKYLIMGNHDIFDINDYFTKAGFYKIVAYYKFDDLWLSHIPINRQSVPHWCSANVHGHLHSNVVNDPAYLNVSVEQVNFTPLSLSDVKKRIKINKDKFDRSGRIINYAFDDQSQWSSAGMSNSEVM